MDFKILLAFSLGMIILAVSPGPGVIASVSTALSKGFKSSLLFISGLVIGDIIFFILAIVGMSAISKIMGQLFFIIKIIGGLYLVYTGFEIIKHRKDEIIFKEGLTKNTGADPKSRTEQFVFGLKRNRDFKSCLQ